MSVTVRKLKLKATLCNSEFKQIVFLVCIACEVIVYLLLTRIDLIVHEQLYDFGLLFSAQWVDPYRILMWSIYACLVTSVVLSGIVLVSDLLAEKQEFFGRRLLLERTRKVAAKLLPLKFNVNVEAPKRPQALSEEHLLFEDGCSKVPEPQVFASKNQSLRINNSTVATQQNAKSPVVAGLEGESKNRINDMLISCPKCKKIFQTPLVMLDFSGAKPGLMNVCPYCNQVLGASEAEKDVFCDLT